VKDAGKSERVDELSHPLKPENLLTLRAFLHLLLS